MLSIRLIVLLLMMASFTTAVDYCQLSCNNIQNIGCNNPLSKGGWGSDCKNPELLKMTSDYKEALVDIHNKYRNMQASGQIKNYEPAVRMAKMRWDADLEYLAELNIRRCIYGHDKCRDTQKYRSAGQNIAERWTTDLNWDRNFTTKDLTDLAFGWFDENKDGQHYGWMDLINKLEEKDFDNSGPDVGHFTQWVQEKAEAIGCAAAFTKMTVEGKETQAVLFACNYSYGNMIGSPVYVAGSKASKCKTGADKTYPGLCSINEVY
ncbi:antigen 5 like allergen Cul n 1-like [Contarinia nasturtii]|uniref:antigen 5 like allergen Cul n 1-like n=1 Tax=Contarinia nasturtii TaxID=265458 RepID=UPI0012D4310B|nr:antigen 5 like allergen Cul n 1-like [Contarinia nasturtii]